MQKKDKILNQRGAVPVLVLLAVIGLLIYLAVSSSASFKDKLFGFLYPKPQSHAAEDAGSVRFVDGGGNTITATSSASVTIKYTLPVWGNTFSIVKEAKAQTVGVGSSGPTDSSSPTPTPTSTPTPSPTPTTTPSPTPVTTSSIVLAEDSSFTANVKNVGVGISSTSNTIDYTFSNSSSSTKNLYVKFIASDNRSQNATPFPATITLVAPSSTPTPTPVVKTPPCGSYGDLNQDGKVTAEDANIALNIFTGSIRVEDTRNADVDGDGSVTPEDARLIQRYVEGLEPTFPVCTTNQKPIVNTLPAFNIGYTAAMLRGSVNPNGLNTVGWFRFSSTNPGSCNNTFGNKAPFGTTNNALGVGTSFVTYAAATSINLSPATTHYFCAIASNSAGITLGNIQQFTTLGSTPAPTPKPDLVVNKVSILGIAKVRGRNSINVEVQNKGNVNVNKSVVVNLLVKQPNGIVLGSCSSPFTALAIGNTRIVQLRNCPLFAVKGTHTLTATVDYTNVVIESNESNNQYSTTVNVR